MDPTQDKERKAVIREAKHRDTTSVRRYHTRRADPKSISTIDNNNPTREKDLTILIIKQLILACYREELRKAAQ